MPFGERSQRPTPAAAVVKDAAAIEEEKRQAKLARIAALMEEVRAKEAQEAKEPAALAESKAADVAQGNDAETELMKLMGLPVAGFDSTKGKPVPDGNVSGAKVHTQRKHRQYMNRKGQRAQHTFALNARTRTFVPRSTAGSVLMC